MFALSFAVNKGVYIIGRSYLGPCCQRCQSVNWCAAAAAVVNVDNSDQCGWQQVQVLEFILCRFLICSCSFSHSSRIRIVRILTILTFANFYEFSKTERILYVTLFEFW